MQDQAEKVMQSLVESYNIIKALKERMASIEAKIPTLPWEEKKAEMSYDQPQQEVPSPAIKEMVRRMEVPTFNDTSTFWKKALKSGEHTKVLLWKDGVATTLDVHMDTRNPLARFRNRHTAILRLRKAGWIVTSPLNSKGNPKDSKFVVATIN